MRRILICVFVAAIVSQTASAQKWETFSHKQGSICSTFSKLGPAEVNGNYDVSDPFTRLGIDGSFNFQTQNYQVKNLRENGATVTGRMDILECDANHVSFKITEKGNQNGNGTCTLIRLQKNEGVVSCTLKNPGLIRVWKGPLAK